VTVLLREECRQKPARGGKKRRLLDKSLAKRRFRKKSSSFTLRVLPSLKTVAPPRERKKSMGRKGP